MRLLDYDKTWAELVYAREPYAADLIQMMPTIDPETIPIVRQLREELMLTEANQQHFKEERDEFEFKMREVAEAANAETERRNKTIAELREELARVTAERDAAQKLLAEHSGVVGCDIITTCFGYPLDKVQNLVEADKAGRCVFTKCKIGDTVFVVGKKKIVKARVQEIYLDDMPELIYLVYFECDNSCDGCPFNSWSQSWEGEWECGGEYGYGSVKQSDFGKTIFLTREAAESALAKEK